MNTFRQIALSALKSSLLLVPVAIGVFASPLAGAQIAGAAPISKEQALALAAECTNFSASRTVNASVRTLANTPVDRSYTFTSPRCDSSPRVDGDNVTTAFIITYTRAIGSYGRTIQESIRYEPGSDINAPGTVSRYGGSDCEGNVRNDFEDTARAKSPAILGYSTERMKCIAANNCARSRNALLRTFATVSDGADSPCP